jgi:phosphatidylinositol alpha-1,6-mannosyltransferase
MLLYSACDLFLLPTRSIEDGNLEGFGIVLLEASLMGKSVIGGDSGGSAEAVVDSKTGLIVNGNDERQIAAAVVRLLSDPQLAERFGRQGRQRVLNEFSSKNQFAAYKKIIKQLMNI